MIEAIAWDGKTITEPGIYTGISLEDYHTKLDLLDAPSVSKSDLKRIFPTLQGSPKQFWYLWKQNPNHITLAPSDALDFGKCVHALLLGDEIFDDKFSVRPEQWKNYGTKAAREWRDNVRAEGRTPVTVEQVQQVKRIAEDAARDPMVQQGILNGSVERSMFIKDEATGLWFRSRIDNQANDGFWADLKTTSSMNPAFIRRQIRDNGYFIQAAGARRAAREFGLPFDSFWNVYVSTADTPDTQPVELKERLLDLGEEFIRAGLDTIAECLKSGIWPGARPYEGQPVDLTDWDYEALEQDLKTPHLEQAA